jgi:hypothetical protein
MLLVTTLLALVTSLFSGAAPASAAYPQACDYWSSPALCIEWTHSWPGGQVRAGPGSGAWWGLKLQTCQDAYVTGCYNGPWYDVTSVGAGVKYTAWAYVGKYNWYRACMRSSQGGNWQCAGTHGWAYLGD